MAMDFPASPALNQVYSSGGASYFWNGYAWEGGGAISPASVTSVSDTPPANPLPGQLWWESDTGYLSTSYNDSNTTQWVQINALQANAVAKTGDTMSGALKAPVLAANGNVGGTIGIAPNTLALDWVAGGGGARIMSFGPNPSTKGGVAVQLYSSDASQLQNGLTISSAGVVDIPAPVASTSKTTGALTVAGGVGIGGHVNIHAAGVTPAPTSAQLSIAYHGNTGADAYGLIFRPFVDSAYPILFYNAAGAGVGSISTSGAATVYTTSSDGRLKEDLQSFDAGNIIDDTEVYDFRWKDLDERSYGIVAQQAVEVYPQAIVHREEDDWWGVDYSKYVPVLLQELKAVRARLAELEAIVSPKKGR
jgi:Chaperone of endosialidase